MNYSPFYWFISFYKKYDFSNFDSNKKTRSQFDPIELAYENARKIIVKKI